MNNTTQKTVLQGAAGQIQALIDTPDGASRGTAVIAHPHPLFGGTMDNKVVQTLARAAVSLGLTAVRFNFRGVGESAGEYTAGVGEAEDMLRVIEQAAPSGALILGGFSFGGFVASRTVEALHASRGIQAVSLIAPATGNFAVAAIPQSLRDCTQVVHGDADDVVPLSATMAWALPQTLPVTVFPGSGHFFHGQLPLLKTRVAAHWRAWL
jgi:uncharacterized protein